MARYDSDTRYDADRRYRRTGDDDRYARQTRSRFDRDDDRLDDARRNLRDEFEGYDREDGRTRWDYAGRGPDDDARNYGPDPGIRDRKGAGRSRSSRYGNDRSDNDRDGDNRGESYLQDRYDRDYNRRYVRDFGNENYRGRYEGATLGQRSRYDDDNPGLYGGRGPHAGVGPEGYARSSERVVEEVNDRLTDDGHVNASAIQVTADGGEVTLTGTVGDRRQKRRAEDLAESVRGVDDVHNRLTLRRDDDAS